MSDLITENINGASISYRIVDNNSVNASFICKDIRAFTDLDILEIISLKADIKGQGRKLLSEICNKYSKYPIILKCEPMYDSEELYEKALK